MRGLAFALVAVLSTMGTGCFGDDDDGDDTPQVDAPVTGADAPPGTADAPPGMVDAPEGTPDAPETTPDGPFVPPGDGGPTADAAVGVLCGDTLCDPATQVCCADLGGSAACVAIGSCSGIPATCDGPEDCDAAEVCCGSFSGANCVPAAECTGGTSMIVCHTAADCSGGQMCCPTPIGFGGYCAASCM